MSERYRTRRPGTPVLRGTGMDERRSLKTVCMVLALTELDITSLPWSSEVKNLSVLVSYCCYSKSPQI
jgi:hypothetical protein